jgi:misacylated tRNA(Ala) deacylase
MTAKLFLEDSYQKNFEAEVTEVGENGVQFDKTIFYAMSGGQPGDTGTLVISKQNVPVIATKKGEGFADIWHTLGEGAPAFNIGDKIQGTIDWETRHKHMRMHTCLHLLCSLIEGDVTGGSVGADKGRLDFNIAADAVDKEELSRRLNDLIKGDHPVTTEWITDEELDANPQLIRTMSVKPPSGGGRIRLVRIGTVENTVDLQPCGGTHVKSTGEIGPMTITKIENKGKQNRRISLAFAE